MQNCEDVMWVVGRMRMGAQNLPWNCVQCLQNLGEFCKLFRISRILRPDSAKIRIFSADSAGSAHFLDKFCKKGLKADNHIWLSALSPFLQNLSRKCALPAESAEKMRIFAESGRKMRDIRNSLQNSPKFCKHCTQFHGRFCAPILILPTTHITSSQFCIIPPIFASSL